MKTKDIAPAKAIHPGEILMDELEAREISQKEFAIKLGVQPTQLNEIIKGKRGITAEHAVLIGKGLNMEPIVWQNLQSLYELDRVIINERTQNRLVAIEEWDKIKILIPEKYLKKMGAISGDPVHDLPYIKEFYDLNTLEELPAVYQKTESFLNRKSTKNTVDKINLMGWVNLIKATAKNIQIEKFDHRKEKEIITGLKKILANNKDTIEKCKKLLASYGINLITLKNPEKCAVDGVCFWSNKNPTIGLSVRYKRIDNFSFTLFHELGHVFCHLKENKETQFIDVELSMDIDHSKAEKEADQYAMDQLINPSNWEDFVTLPNRLEKKSMVKFAQLEGVHPAVVKGRLCFELNSYTIKVDIDNLLG